MLPLACLLSVAQVELRPGPVAVDRFHPERAAALEPRRGGSATIHVPALPPSLNGLIESSGVARQILGELHDSLLRRDFESWDYQPSLARAWRVDDTLYLKSGAVEFGDSRTANASTLERVERGTVFTFELREGVRWHDGHPFDARDVVFSFECLRNPAVRCDRKRFQFERIAEAEALGPLTVRFRFEHPYFLATSCFDESLTLLPAHVYDLSDPDNPARKSGATSEEQARVVNEGPANRQWIGLGPYRLSSWSGDVLEAQRFDGYHSPAGIAWLDRLRWRAIADNQAATAALLAGELDVFDRLSVADYFGGRTAGPQFEERFYKGFFYTPALSMTVWNTARPALSDARVRTALGMCFDWNAFIASFYRGLAFRVTGEQMPFGPNYDRELAPLLFAPARATELLAEAGWIDRDGDGRLDKDGAALELAYLYPAGNEVSRTFGEAFQAELAKLGVGLRLDARDNAGLADALRKRDFDAAALALALPFESDPEQLWHSKWASSASANRSGLRDPRVDELIERLQLEPAPAARAESLRALQRRIHELQPVMFGVWAPHRVGVARHLRGVQFFALDPGFSPRRWFSTAPR